MSDEELEVYDEEWSDTYDCGCCKCCGCMCDWDPEEDGDGDE